VWKATIAAKGFERVLIATGDEDIRSTAQSFGATVCYDTRTYPNGTERAAGATEHFTQDVVVVQADQPGLSTQHLEQLLMVFRTTTADMLTACVPLARDAHNDEDIVKCWEHPTNKQAVFSRHMPPDPVPCFRHIGLYAYRKPALVRYAASQSCEAEINHRLEQLRSLQLGMQVRLTTLTQAAPCVDRPDDLQRLDEWFSRSTP